MGQGIENDYGTVIPSETHRPSDDMRRTSTVATNVATLII